jgi:hypothetical protein
MPCAFKGASRGDVTIVRPGLRGHSADLATEKLTASLIHQSPATSGKKQLWKMFPALILMIRGSHCPPPGLGRDWTAMLWRALAAKRRPWTAKENGAGVDEPNREIGSPGRTRGARKGDEMTSLPLPLLTPPLKRFRISRKGPPGWFPLPLPQ